MATTTLTRNARMTDEEKQARAADKKAAAHAEKLASLVILGRATFKATGAILYGVQSGEKIYHLTMIDGVVRSCVDSATGESCKSRQYSGHCVHEERVMRYEAQRQSELAVAAQVAPLVVGEQFNRDLPAHVDDELSGQDDVFECVYNALTFGTINRLEDIMQRAQMIEKDLVTNALEVLCANARIVVRKVERGVFWIDTPAQAYRTTYSGDFAA